MAGLESNADQHDLHDATAALNSCRGLELAEKAVAALMRGYPNMTKHSFVAFVSEKCGLENLSDLENLWQKPSTACSAVLADACKAGSVSVEQALISLHVVSTHAVFIKEDVDALEWFCRRVHIDDKPSSVDEMRFCRLVHRFVIGSRFVICFREKSLKIST